MQLLSEEKQILELAVRSPFTVTVPVSLHPGIVHPPSQPTQQAPHNESPRRRPASESRDSERRPMIVKATSHDPTSTTDDDSTAGSVWDDTHPQSPQSPRDHGVDDDINVNANIKSRPLSTAHTAISDAPSARSSGSNSSSKSYNGVRIDTLSRRIPYALEENDGPPLVVHETVGYIHMQSPHPHPNSHVHSNSPHRSEMADIDDVDARLKAVSLGFPISLRPRSIPNARAIFSSDSSTSVVDYRFIRFAGLIPSMRPVRPSIDRVSIIQLGGSPTTYLPSIPDRNNNASSSSPSTSASTSSSSPNHSHGHHHNHYYHVYGSVLVPYDAGPYSFEQDCWVVDLPPGLPLDMILGIDWMERWDARVEVSLEGMRVSGARVSGVDEAARGRGASEGAGAGAEGGSSGSDGNGERRTNWKVARDTYNSMPPEVPS